MFGEDDTCYTLNREFYFFSGKIVTFNPYTSLYYMSCMLKDFL